MDAGQSVLDDIPDRFEPACRNGADQRLDPAQGAQGEHELGLPG